VRVNRPGKLTLAYWPVDAPDSIRLARGKTGPGPYPMGILTATLLRPGARYAGEIRHNGRKLENSELQFQSPIPWPFRRDPPDFKLAAGSCTYINEAGYDRPGEPYGGDYRIFQSILDQEPDLMLWLGDNTYYRDPDFSSRSGMIHRFAHTRETPEMQGLLRAQPNYGIWDDHDYGPNDSDRSWAYKDWSLDVHRAFWPNPSVGAGDVGGITSRFVWNDVDVYLLDNRWFRSPNKLKGEERVIIGKEQEDWLIESLVSSRAPFKIVAVGGQLLTDAERYETWVNIAPEERERLLQRIDAEGISGVVFLTGDRHHSEISRIDLPGGAWVYDITTSPLTSRAHRQSEEPNRFRVAGSLLEQRNFVLLEVSGARKERVMMVRFFDSDGALLFEHRIEAP
jgi:alkaline phosphatase D